MLDAPLLFESKADVLCKHTVVVHCNETTQVLLVVESVVKSVVKSGKVLDAPLHFESKADMVCKNTVSILCTV